MNVLLANAVANALIDVLQKLSQMTEQVCSSSGNEITEDEAVYVEGSITPIIDDPTRLLA